MTARPREVLRRLLVVDDDRASRAVLAALLRRADYLCDEVGSGEEALGLAAEIAYDAILLDLHMPGLDGFATAEGLFARYGSTRFPILAVSTDDHPATLDRCRAVGMRGPLRKPIGMERLASELALLFGEELHPRGCAESDNSENHVAPLLDFGAALRRLDGDEALLRMQLELVLAEAPGLIAELKSAERERVRLVAHRLRGLFAACDQSELAAAAAEHEERASRGAPALPSAPLVDSAAAFLERLRAHLGLP